MDLRRRGLPPPLRALVLIAAFALLLAVGCSRDAEPASSGTAGGEASLFRNLGKR